MWPRCWNDQKNACRRVRTVRQICEQVKVRKSLPYGDLIIFDITISKLDFVRQEGGEKNSAICLNSMH